MLRKRILSLLLVFIITFTVVNINYNTAKAEAISITAGAVVGAGGLTVGGILTLALGLVAVGYGTYLVVDNWDTITSECGKFLNNATAEVRTWWNGIVGSAVPVDEETVPLPDAIASGKVINFFDYYVPTSGSGGDPNNKLDFDPKVMGALYSFLLTYYGYDALMPGKVLSDKTISSMSIDQLASYIDFQPASELLYEAYQNSLEGYIGYQSFTNFGLLYILFTPKKPVDMYTNDSMIYGVLDVPDLSDTIFVGVKDDGTAVIHAMGYTGNEVCGDEYTSPYHPDGIDYKNEPFMSTLHCNHDGAIFYFKSSSPQSYKWTTASGLEWVNRTYSSLNSDNINLATMESDSNPLSDKYNLPLSAYYRHYDLSYKMQDYYYHWDNVIYNDGNLVMGDYNINFVGGRDYFNFYQYDYEDWLSNKVYYQQCFKNLTKSKGRIESYEGTTFEKFIPGETYTLPKSNYKMSLPDEKNITVDVNDLLMQKLSEVDLSIDDNFDRVIKAVYDANKASIDAGKEPVIDRQIVEVGSEGETPGNIDLSSTNELIDGLPDRIAENMKGSISEAFTPTGDFTSINNLKRSFGNFFNFDILYKYHEMIEDFLEQRVKNEDPPVFKIYPRQSGLVYFDKMPDEITVISFDWMEKQIFTWDVTIRQFIRAILTFFVFAVWLKRTINKLPKSVSGL